MDGNIRKGDFVSARNHVVKEKRRLGAVQADASSFFFSLMSSGTSFDQGRSLE